MINGRFGAIPVYISRICAKALVGIALVDKVRRAELDVNARVNRHVTLYSSTAFNYSLVNARVGLRWSDGWAVSLWARNLFDTNYFELRSAAPANSGLYVGLPGDARAIGVTMRLSFRGN